MRYLTQLVACVSFCLFAFHVSADLKADQKNDSSKPLAVRFGPGPNLKDGPNNASTPLAIHFGPGPNLKDGSDDEPPQLMPPRGS